MLRWFGELCGRRSDADDMLKCAAYEKEFTGNLDRQMRIASEQTQRLSEVVELAEINRTTVGIDEKTRLIAESELVSRMTDIDARARLADANATRWQSALDTLREHVRRTQQTMEIQRTTDFYELVVDMTEGPDNDESRHELIRMEEMQEELKGRQATLKSLARFESNLVTEAKRITVNGRQRTAATGIIDARPVADIMASVAQAQRRTSKTASSGKHKHRHRGGVTARIGGPAPVHETRRQAARKQKAASGNAPRDVSASVPSTARSATQEKTGVRSAKKQLVVSEQAPLLV